MQPIHRRWLLGIALTLLALPCRATIVLDLSWVDTASPQYQRFKGFVDAALAGNPGYGFTATDAAWMYRLSNDARYAQLAVATVEAQVVAAEQAIANQQRPEVAGDSYLHVGPMIGDLALTYDWCAAYTTGTQRARWAAYAQQAVWNVWHHAQASWGGVAFPWSGWATTDPANNYYYSFVTATMYWGLASNDTTWLNLLATDKLPALRDYVAGIAGGGSQEGSGYGLSHRSLFGLYRLWRDSTGTDLANANAHLTDSIRWWIHATVPTRDKVAPIGDQARVSEPVIYDYHRHLVLEARQQTLDAAARADAAWWLHRISDQDMESGFNYRHNLLPAGTDTVAPTALVYHAAGTGQLFARSGWDTAAIWLNFSAGPYLQSHAHQDQGSFTLYEGTWLAVTENIWTHSGIQQGTDTHNVLRFERNGHIVPQRDGTTSTMSVTPGAGGAVHAVADLTPAYAGDAAVGGWQRTIDFAARKLTVSDSFTLGSGSTATFQVNTPLQPVISGRTAQAGPLTIRVLAPPGATLSALDWTTRSGDDETYHRGWRLDVSGGSTGYVVEFSSSDVLFANGFDAN